MPEKKEEKIEITRERFKELNEKEDLLCALEAAGLDNWDGYELAHEILEEWNNG